MAIKWNIATKATEARGHMDAISRAYDKLNANARGHRSDVEGLATQVNDMQSDLEAAANVMGNGGEHLEDSQEVSQAATGTFQG